MLKRVLSTRSGWKSLFKAIGGVGTGSIPPKKNKLRVALEKGGWIITADPYELSVDDIDVEIDLAAEQLMAAERNNQKIAVGVKSFISPSNVSDFHTALGQFLNYRDALAKMESDRQLYLAVQSPVYEDFFQRHFIAAAVDRYQLQLLIYDVAEEAIVKWL